MWDSPELPTPVAGPFYFAWCNAGETFNASVHNRMDELIFGFELKLDEGQIPTLMIRMANRYIDVTSPTVKTWAWFSFDCGSPHGILPIFYGRVVSIPNDIQNTQVEYIFLARSADWLSQKSALAWSYINSDYIDPIWLDDTKRSDPDALIEATGLAWEINPRTLQWSLSDLFSGEDGTLVYGDYEALWSSVRWNVKEIPKRSIRFDCNVRWMQRDAGGAVPVCITNVKTYSGASLLSDWPTPGTTLGGGWSVLFGRAYDLWHVGTSENGQESYSYQNTATQHANGDTMSLNIQHSYPKHSGITWTTSEESKGGVLAGAKDLPGSQSDPSFSAKKSWSVAPLWNIGCYLILQYKAERKRSETLSFDLTTDLQSAFVDASTPDVYDVREFNSVDLSEPFINFRPWSTLKNTAVEIGQIIKPDVVVGPGGLSFQVCITAGTTSNTAPEFSDIIGQTTSDGSAVWVCVGADAPKINNWSPYRIAHLGEIIAPIAPSWLPYFATLGFSTAVAEGQIMRVDWEGVFVSCLIAGQTTGRLVFINPIPGALSIDGSVVWQTIGPNLASGTFQICTSAGQSGLAWPPFSPNVGGTCLDGSTTWKSLGSGGPSIEMPIGGYPGHTISRYFFPSERGRKSIKYLLLMARAVLLKSARAVEVSWECSFAKGVIDGITLRKNASIIDDRLPGGSATGKITSARLYGSGNNGRFRTAITIGCAIGNGGTITTSEGTPTYGEVGYVDKGYQQYVGELHSVGDISWPELYADPHNDDGLTFPITLNQVAISNTFVGSLQQQHQVISSYTRGRFGYTYAPSNAINRIVGGASLYQDQDEAIQAALEAFGGSIYYQLALRPVTGQSFNQIYLLEPSNVIVPNQWGE